MSGSHLSKEFFDLVKQIGESRSKQEEDKIIVHEVHTLKQKMSAKDVPSKKMKEYLIRMIYVEMLGHDASFGHIHAVKMAHNRALLEKRVGYLAVSLTLHKDHSFMLLLINTMQQDLKSDNYLEASMALTVVSKLVNTETIPAILPLVVRLLEHKEGNVKKKAVMVLHRFHQLDPSTVATLGAPIRKALCDSNISVMAASLNLFLDLCSSKPSAYKDLVPDFVSILKQVIEHRLPRDFDYHRMPAPWVQLKLLQILAVLGASDKNASEGMYEILREVMKRADIGINVGYAIVYECVRTVTSIYPDPALIEDAANSISRFITSDNHNLKYLGVNALAAIVQIDSKYAAEHQLLVIDALEDPDETLKRKTLDLLYSMTNPQNVTVIVQKLTQYLQSSTDQYLRAELVSRINQLAEKFAPSNEWFIQTMNNVFELGGSTGATGGVSQTLGGSGVASTPSASKASGSEKIIKNEMSQSILRLISENANQLLLNYPGGVVPEDEDDIRTYAVDTYIALLSAKRKTYTSALPDILLQVIAWVLGEYGNLSAVTPPAEVLNLLVQLMERQVDSPALTKSWIMSAILKMSSKILAAGGTVAPAVVALVTKYQNSLFVDLQQRSYEFLELLKSPRTFTAVVPPENTFDLELQVDPNLSFLDGYVQAALRNGAKPYHKDPDAAKKRAEAAENLYGAAGGGGGSRGLKFQAYAAPEKEVASAPVHTSVGGSNGNAGLFEQYTPSGASSSGVSASAETPNEMGLRLGTGVARRWGPSGYNDPEAEKPAPAAAAAPYQTGPTMVAMPSPGQQSSAAAASSAAAFARQQEQERESAAAAQRERDRKAKEIAARPRELTEREKMAQNLFAGVGGAAAPPPAKRVAARPAFHGANAGAAAAAQPAAKVAAPAADFLGGLIDATVVTPQKPAASAGSADLLDLFGGGSSSSVASPPTTVPAARAAPVQQQSSGDLMDMFGGGSSSMSSNPASLASAPALFENMSISQPAASSSRPSALLMDDPFGFNTPAVATSNGGGDLFSLGEGATKYGLAGSHMSSQLSGLQKSPAGEVTVVSKPNIQLSYIRGYTDQATVVALFLSNKSNAAFSGLRLTFALPNGLVANIQGDGGASAQQQGNQQVVDVASVPPRSTTTVMVQLTVRELTAFNAASGPLALSAGSITYSGGDSSPFSIDLTASDFLRPAQMKTDVYGAAWKVLQDEVKGVARPTTCNTPADFMSRMTAFHAFPVQTIGQENICAARVVAAPGVQVQQNAFLVLVHGKVHSHIDLIVRSKNRDLSGRCAKELAVVLK